MVLEKTEKKLVSKVWLYAFTVVNVGDLDWSRGYAWETVSQIEHENNTEIERDLNKSCTK
jgi:hypothetical protein